MATASVVNKNEERRKKVLLGTLPEDFLRISATPQQQQEAADRQAALALQHQMTQPTVGRLNIMVGQAKLIKNYGMTRMDPYVRLRVGHYVYETQTDPSGGKNPRWNKCIQSFLPQGVNTIYLEIYDECSFTMDELVAWAHIPIPETVIKGETYEDWFPLNGKQGDGKEGMVNLVLSYSVVPASPYSLYPAVAPVVMVPNTGTMFGYPQYSNVPVYTQPCPPNQQTAPPPPPPPPVQPQLTEEDFKQIQEMFPNIDREVIKSVCEANRGNKAMTINSLLQMNE